MTFSNIDRRLRKVEASSRPPRGVFFVAWGRTPDEIERGLDEARRTRTIVPGDPVVRALWPFGPALPSNRWARDETPHFTRAEFGALALLVDDARERLIEELDIEVRRRGETPLAIPVEDDPRPRDETTSQMHDAALFRAVIAALLDKEPAPMTEGRLDHVVRCISAVGLRCSIRGCDDALDRATEEAAAAPRH